MNFDQKVDGCLGLCRKTTATVKYHKGPTAYEEHVEVEYNSRPLRVWSLPWLLVPTLQGKDSVFRSTYSSQWNYRRAVDTLASYHRCQRHLLWPLLSLSRRVKGANAHTSFSRTPANPLLRRKRTCSYQVSSYATRITSLTSAAGALSNRVIRLHPVTDLLCPVCGIARDFAEQHPMDSPHETT